jgi:hypothetical protein
MARLPSLCPLRSCNLVAGFYFSATALLPGLARLADWAREDQASFWSMAAPSTCGKVCSARTAAIRSAILRRNRELLDRTVVALLETETLNEPEIELLKAQVVVEGPGSVTLLHSIEGARKANGPPVARPTAEARARSTVPVAPK